MERRLTTFLSIALFVGGASSMSAQDDLSLLVAEDAPAVQLELQDSSVEEVLETLARIGGFQLQLSPGVSDAAPLTADFEDADLSNVLRFVLDAAAVNYRVVERTLVVGSPAAFLESSTSAYPWCPGGLPGGRVC